MEGDFEEAEDGAGDEEGGGEEAASEDLRYRTLSASIYFLLTASALGYDIGRYLMEVVVG